MAEYKVVDAEKLDAELSSVADAIRTKGGTSESLTFPQGFVDAVGAISSGGGEDDFIGIKYSSFTDSPYKKPKTADARSLDKILKESGNVEKDTALWFAFANADKTANKGYFTELEEVYVPTYATSFRQTFDYCSKLTTIHGDLSNITQIDQAFRDCVNLDINAIIARMPKLQSIGGNNFYGCTQLTEITLPATITYMTGTAFNGCANLTKIKCLFAEGSVTGQPWGAKNAVVEYVTEV